MDVRGDLLLDTCAILVFEGVAVHFSFLPKRPAYSNFLYLCYIFSRGAVAMAVWVNLGQRASGVVFLIHTPVCLQISDKNDLILSIKRDVFLKL